VTLRLKGFAGIAPVSGSQGDFSGIRLSEANQVVGWQNDWGSAAPGFPQIAFRLEQKTLTRQTRHGNSEYKTIGR
jgi:hypothetical protein